MLVVFLIIVECLWKKRNMMVTQVVAHHTTDCEIPCWISTASRASFSLLLISGVSLSRSLTEMQHDWLLTFQQKWRLSLRWKMSEEDETRWRSSRCIEAIERRLELKRSSKGSVFCTLINSNGEIQQKQRNVLFVTNKHERIKNKDQKGAVHGGPHRTMDSVLASYPAGPGFDSPKILFGIRIFKNSGLEYLDVVEIYRQQCTA